MACSMDGSAISMCAISTTLRCVVCWYSLPNSSSMRLESLRREPWSTMTTPTAGSAAAAAGRAPAPHLSVVPEQQPWRWIQGPLRQLVGADGRCAT
jgi:hypothetical protein